MLGFLTLRAKWIGAQMFPDEKFRFHQTQGLYIVRERNRLYGVSIPRKVDMNVLPRMRYYIKSLTEPGDSGYLSFSISLGSLPEGSHRCACCLQPGPEGHSSVLL